MLSKFMNKKLDTKKDKVAAATERNMELLESFHK